MPHTLLDTIRFFLENHIDTTLKNEINLTLIENEYILIPIAITPKFDALTLEIDNKIGVNINMIRDLYVYRSNDRKSKKYADFYPAFYTIIFAPITYPYRNIKLSKNPYEKLHKNNIH